VCTRLRIELPAVPEKVPSARRAITRLCENAGIEDELTGQIRLAVTEACTNCVLHAYDGDGADTFALEARVEDDVLVVVVRDAGAGITPRGSAKAGLKLRAP
jgi:serine/threonine-protein kinase RsbW